VVPVFLHLIGTHRLRSPLFNLNFQLHPFLTAAAMKLLRIIAPVFIGAIIGGLMGYFGQCASGTCPLTSTWWRGAIYGSVLGTLFALSSVRS